MEKKPFPKVEKQVVQITLDDSQITESLDAIEKRLDRIQEKANRLKSTLDECGETRRNDIHGIQISIDSSEEQSP